MSGNSVVLLLVLLAGLSAGLQYFLIYVHGKIRLRISPDQPFAQLVAGGLSWIYRTISLFLWTATAATLLYLVPFTKESAHRLAVWAGIFFGELRDVLFEPFARVGNSSISVFSLFQILIFISVVVFISRGAKRLLMNQILSKTSLDTGIQHAVITFAQYLIITIGILVGLQTAGIDLSTITILAGAVGVGVGFGLQNIANNFISGLIILFERPIKIGDRIEVGNVTGDVVKISARSTTVLTNDNIAIIIPNSSFISSNVINWSHGDPRVRFRVPVGVAYGSDIRLVEKLLLEVAGANDNVLKDPPPRVIFRAFGDSSLEFELRVWTIRLLHRRGVLLSQLNFAIYEKLQAHHVEIPFPQRDLHFKLDPETLKSIVTAVHSPPISLTETNQEKG